MPRMISIKEASAATGLSYGTIRQWCITGQFRGFVMSGNKYWINEERFKEFLNGDAQDAGMDKTT